MTQAIAPKTVANSRSLSGIDIESIGLKEVHNRRFEYYILLRVKEPGETYQYNYTAVINRRFFNRGFKLSHVYPTSVSPTKYHEESHSLIKEALTHLMSDLSNW